tara:strand:+ start:120 stop:680 length:561 start_codon:yes stop_codon:yes gene_type:complete
MTRIDSKIKKDVYESKKARDILDEEFTEFLPIKRNIGEFFDIYNTKFYNISNETHAIFAQKSLDYIIQYVNPLTKILTTALDRLKNIQEDIDSIELFHPIYPNGTVLKLSNSSAKYIIQSGKKRKIETEALYKEIKQIQKETKTPDKEFWIQVNGGLSNIPSSKPIKLSSDLLDSTYIINTYNGPY